MPSLRVRSSEPKSAKSRPQSRSAAFLSRVESEPLSSLRAEIAGFADFMLGRIDDLAKARLRGARELGMAGYEPCEHVARAGRMGGGAESPCECEAALLETLRQDDASFLERLRADTLPDLATAGSSSAGPGGGEPD